MLGRALLLATILAGCTQRNPEYCERDDDCATATPHCELGDAGLRFVCVALPGGGGDGGVASDASRGDARSDAGECSGPTQCPATLPVCTGGTCGACTAPADCQPRSATPHCAPTGACVACTLDDHCGAAAPVCDLATYTCRGCRADDECVEDICNLATGACPTPVEIVYVSKGGTGTCDQGSACGNLTQALTKVTSARPFVRIASESYGESLSISGKTVVLVGVGGPVTIDPSGGTNVPALSVSAAADVTLRHLRLANAIGNAAATGVSCSGARLALHDVRVENNAAVGVNVADCTLTMTRSTVIANRGGGVRIVTSTFDLVNNIIGGNGSLASSFGGVLINEQPPGASRFEFNTVAYNMAMSGFVAGVTCQLLTTPIAMVSSIVYFNAGNDQLAGECSFTTSDIGPTLVEGNFNVDPAFVDPATGNYHLLTSSPVIDKAGPSTLDEDIDGEPRPQGDGRDIGADEVR